MNLGGTLYYFYSVLDGFSRAIVHWEIRPSMTEAEVEFILQRARERYLDAKPRVISDNGPQFIAKDFKEFIRVGGMSHVRISLHYPQSYGKIERFHKTLKSEWECYSELAPLSGVLITKSGPTLVHSASADSANHSGGRGDQGGAF
ncbi:MAG: hypothetical protein AMXMBFR64_23020 [Myxococcales bacterium]